MKTEKVEGLNDWRVEAEKQRAGTGTVPEPAGGDACATAVRGRERGRGRGGGASAVRRWQPHLPMECGVRALEKEMAARLFTLLRPGTAAVRGRGEESVGWVKCGVPIFEF